MTSSVFLSRPFGISRQNLPKIYFVEVMIWLYLCSSILTLTQAYSGHSIDNIAFVPATTGLGHAQTCISKKLQPYDMDAENFNWNLTTMEYIVSSQLNKKIMNGNALGIKGCCAPGLWCRGDYCFTQSFGQRFANYGWLANDNLSVPVFSCWTPNLLKQTLNITSVSSDGNNAQLIFQGRGFGTDPSKLKVDSIGETCNSVQLWNCKACKGINDCPIGSSCMTVGSSGSFCFPICAGINDASCPCNQVCNNVNDFSGTGTSLCLPASTQQLPNYIQSTCGKLSPDVLVCSANSSLYAPINYKSYNSEITTGTWGDFYRYSGQTVASYECTSNTQCYDGNVCTTDLCIEGNCTYVAMSDCSSILQTIREQFTPYNYLDVLISNATTSQGEFFSQVTAHGVQTYPKPTEFDTVQLPWNFLYFGNKINQVSITPFGALSLPPVGDCAKIECLLFSSSANVLSPWYDSSWIWGSAGVYKYLQSSSNHTKIRNIAANALHVLYTQMELSGLGFNHVFSVSIYEDGSIRYSYFDAITSVDAYSPSALGPTFFGLWGSRASLSPSNLRYYLENATQPYLGDGVDIVYCPFNSTACIPETCVTANTILTIRMNVSETCTAITPEYNISYSCVWFGGLAKTSAWISQPTRSANPSGQVSCLVPVLNVTEGSIVPLEVVTEAIPNSSQYPTDPFIFTKSGTKTVYTVITGDHQELARANLMIRYYETSAKSCGCSPLQAYSGQTCNNQGICVNPKQPSAQVNVADCAGTPFGSAYIDACSRCTGGYTGVIPTFDCNITSSSELFSLLTQTIILLMIICCMTFITSSVSYSIRRMLHARSHNQELFFLDAELANQFFEGGANDRNNPSRSRRGLTEFEKDAIGQFVFSKTFYEGYLKEKKHKELEEESEASKALVSENSPASAPPVPSEKEKKVSETSASAETTDLRRLEEGQNDHTDPVKGGEVEGEERKENTGELADSNGCECSICLMEIEEGNVCRVLPEPCGHIFHLSCIDTWFDQSSQCPLCKRSMRAILQGVEEDPPVNDLRFNPNRTLPSLINNATNREVITNSNGIRTTIRYITPYRMPNRTNDGPEEEVGILLTSFTRIPSANTNMNNLSANNANNNTATSSATNNNNATGANSNSSNTAVSGATNANNTTNNNSNSTSESNSNGNANPATSQRLGTMGTSTSSPRQPQSSSHSSPRGGLLQSFLPSLNLQRQGFVPTSSRELDAEERSSSSAPAPAPNRHYPHRIVVPRSRSSSYDEEL